MRAFAPIQVEAEGLCPRIHRFVSRGQVLGALETAPLGKESVFRQADGQRFVIQREGLLTGKYSLRQGDRVLGQANRMDLTYESAPYCLRRSGLRPAYELRDGQDAAVFAISRALSVTPRAEIDMQHDADLLLVVLAYFVLRRNVQRWRGRVGASR